MTNPFSFPKNPGASKDAALKAARAQAAQKIENPAAVQKWINPEDAPERIHIIFDDSGSMSFEIKNAKDGVIEFFRNCIPNQSSVYVKMICAFNPDIEKWNSNLIQAAEFLQKANAGLGGTPLFEHMNLAFNYNVKPTRMVVFTDGSPSDHLVVQKYEEQREKPWTQLERWKASADQIIGRAKEHKVPIDTVFFGSADYNQDEIALLKYFSDQTGGYFLHFDPAKVNFRTAFKYLAGTNRLMLASESVRREIESGKRS
jgi:hypothetical protein